MKAHILVVSSFKVFLALLFPWMAFAAPTGLTYQGRILKSDGTPLEYANVSFIFQITNPSGSCVIYQEQVTGYNMVNSGGVFDIAIGGGSVQYPLGGSFTVLDTFNNSSTFNCGTCSSSSGTYTCSDSAATYTSSVSDGRKLRVQFYDGGGWKTISPDNVIRSVPYAGYAVSAQKLGNKIASDFVEKAGLPDCSGGKYLTWNGTALVCEAVSGASGGTVTAVTGTSPISVATGTTTPVISIATANVTTTGALSSADWNTFNNKLGTMTAFTGDVSGTYNATSVDKIKGKVISPATYAAGQVLRYDGTNWINALIDISTDVTGTLAIANGGTGATTVIGARTNLGLGTAATVNTGSAAGNIPVLGVGGLVANQLCTSDGTASGIICNTTMPTSSQWTSSSSDIYYNTGKVGIGTTTPATTLDVGGAVRIGADATACAAGIAGAIRYNGGNVEFCNGSSWAVLAVSGSGITSLNGLTSNTQTFATPGTAGTAPAWSSSGSTHTLNIPMASGAGVTAGLLSNADYVVLNAKLGTTTAFSGDVSGTYNAISVDKIKGRSVSATAPTDTQFLVYDNGNSQYSPVTMSGDATMSNTGAVTLKNTGTAGTYTKVTTDAQGRVTSGTTLSAADIPNLDWTKITTGKPTTLGGYGITDGIQNLGGTPGVQTGTLAARPAFGTAGQLYIASDNNTIYRDTGTAWVAIGDGAVGGVTSVTANAPLASSGGATPNLTLSQANTTTDGYLTSTDWNAFNSKLGTITAFTGDVSGTYNAMSVDKIKGKAIAPTAYAAGQVLRYDGASWVNALIDASTDLTGTLGIANGGTGATTAAGARTNLGLGTAATVNTGSAAGNIPVLGIGGLVANQLCTSDGTASGIICTTSMPVSSQWVTSGSDIYYNTGKVGVGTTTPATALDVSGAVRVGTDATACAAGIAGAIRYNGGNVEYCNGTAWTAFAASGSGITSLNGLTSNTQTFATPGATGTAPSWSSSGSAHTLNIPMASGAGVTAGLLNKTDYDAFNAKLGTSTSFSGDVSGSYNSTSVDKIKGRAVSSTAPTDTQFLVYNNGTTQYTPVSMSGDATMSNTGAVTLKNTGTAGTYTKVTTDAQGRVTSGANLSAADIPNLDWSKITTGTPTTLSGYGITDGIQNLGGTPSVQTGTLAARPAFGTAGRLYVASDTNTLYRDTGSAWVAIGDGAAGGVTSVTASAPLSSSGGATPNLTISQANTTTSGYLSSTDWNTFNNKLGTATSFSGDISGAYNVTSVDKIKGKSVAPAAYATGQVLRYDGTSWVNALIDASTDLTGTLAIANGGTGATTAAGARTNLGLGTAATVNTGSAAGNIPVLGIGGLVANQLCTSDGTASGIICTTSMPVSSQWVTSGSDIYYNTGNVGIGIATPATKLDVGGAVRVGTDATACAAGIAGAIRYNSGNVEYCNGSAWTAFAASGAGITSFNGLTSNTQTLAAPGTSGTAPAWSSSGSAHTLNIPMANTSSVTAGLISKSEYDTFNNKLGTATSFSGDVSGAYNSTSVDKIKGRTVSATAPTDTQFLVYNNGTTQYVPVSMSGDATMSNTGAVNLKNTGTAGTYTKVTTDAQGRVTSGTTLVVADIPNLDWSKITTGIPTTLGGYGITDGIQNLGGTPSVQTGTLAARPAFGTAGRLYVASDNNTLYRDTGSAWVAIGDGASGGVTTVTASAPLSSSGGATPNLTISQANTSTSGYLSSTDWNTFNDKLGIATSFSGDVSGVYNATSVDKIKGKTVSPAAYASGQVLRYDGTNWVNAVINASTDLTGTLAVANGGTGATTAAGARTNLGLGTAATVNTGSAAGNIPLLGVGGLVANQLCTSDGTASGIICNTTMPTSSQWTTTGSDIYYNTGKVGVGTISPATKLDVGGAIRVGTDATACVAGIAGAIRYNGGNVEYCNGTSWAAFAASGAGITSLNGLTTNTQTFATPGTTGTAPAWSSSGSAHTLNIPMASGAGVTAGLLNKTDYDAFNAKLGTSTSFSGDVSGTYNSTSVDKIKGRSVASTAPTDAQFLVYDNGATQYAPASMSGDATMSNAGAVTLKNTGTAGTYTKVTTDAQGRVTSGTTLSAADIPNLDWSKITTGKPTTLSGYGITDGIQNLGGTPSVQTGTLAARPAFGTAGRLYVASDNNTLYRDTGSAWVAIGDGATGSVTSVTASAPLSSSGGATPNLTISQANTSTNGYLSSTDWNTFNNKLGTATSFSGDVSGAYNATSVDKIKGKTVSPAAYAANQVLRYDGTNWVNASINAATDLSGTVPVANGGTGATTAAAARTNLGLGTAATQNTGSASGNVPLIGVSGITNNMMCTSDGTGSIICNTAMPLGASTAFSGDVSGTYNATSVDKIKGKTVSPAAYAANQVLRYDGTNWVNAAINAATDLSGIVPVANGGTGASSLTAGSLVVGNGTSAVTALAAGTTGNVLYASGASTWASGTPDTAGLVDKTATQTITGVKTFQFGDNNDTVGTALTVQRLRNNGTAPGAGHGAALAYNLETSTNNTMATAGSISTQWEVAQTGAATQDSAMVFNTSLDGTTAEKMRITSAGNVNITGQIQISGGTPGAGKVLTSDASGLATWQTPSGGGITSLNGLTAGTQTFANGTSGTAPAFSSTTSTHTLNIPMANTASVTAGLISKTEYDTFNNKLGTATAHSGDVSGTYNAMSVDKIKGKTVSPAAYAANQVLRYDGTNWVNAAINAATDLSGIVPVANGGTGASSLGSGNLLVGSGTGALTSLAAGVAGNVVYSTGVTTWASGTPDTAGLVDKTTTQTISGAKAFSNYVQMNAQNQVRFADSDSTNYVAIRSPATVTSNVTLTLPTTAGASGQVLSTDGTGILSWATGNGDFKADGTVPMTGQFQAQQGSAAAPGITFSGATNHGFYHVGGNFTSYSSAGTEKLRMSTNGIMAINNANFMVENTCSFAFCVGLNSFPSAAQSPTLSDTRQVFGIDTNLSGSGGGLLLTGGRAQAGGTNLNGGNLLLQSGTSTGTGSSEIRFLTSTAGASGTADNAPSEKMRINSAGNVGIGTTSPSNVLTVVHPTDYSYFETQKIDNASAPVMVLRRTRSDATNPSAGFGGALHFQNEGYNSMTFGTASIESTWEVNQTNSSTDVDSNLIFSTNKDNALSEKVRITSSGYVGIGTSSPSRRLEVQSTATGTETLLSLLQPNLASGASTGLGFGKSLTANNAAYVYYYDNTTQANRYIGIGNWGGAAQLAILNGGNVGIGTTSPGSKLEVADSTIAINTLALNNTNGGAVAYSALAFQKNGTTQMSIQMDRSNAGSRTLSIVDNPANLVYMHFNSSGNVGIGTTSPGYKLDVQGGDINASGSVRSAGVALTSDIRFKKDIQVLDHSLEKILKLRGVSYNWKTQEYPERKFNSRHQIGVIAQEVEAVFPELVDTDKSGYKSVNYPALVGPLVESTKSLYGMCKASAEQMQALKNKVNELAINDKKQDREIASVKAENEKLKRENAAIKSYLCAKDPHAVICK